jgi:hypothetical protein
MTRRGRAASRPPTTHIATRPGLVLRCDAPHGTDPGTLVLSLADPGPAHPPSGQTFAALRGAKGFEQLVNELRQLAPALVGLEGTGFEITLATALASLGLPLATSIHVRSGILLGRRPPPMSFST